MKNSEKYGSEPSSNCVANYFYSAHTTNSNIQKHLYLEHAEEYDKAVQEHNWPYKLSSEAFARNPMPA
jgi:hypothetical protein